MRSFQSEQRKTRVILCTAPPVRPGLGLDDHRIEDEINPRIKRVGKDMRLRVVDLHYLFRDRSDLFPDKIHPNEEGARRIAEAVAEMIHRVAK